MTIAATGSTGQTSTPATSRTVATGADFNMFLRLLTTQMQNQDPLDPMDTSEYTQQLVQYSQVEQSMQQTGVLRDILSRLTTQDMAQSTGLIGRSVEFDTAAAGLGNGPAQWNYSLPRNAVSVTATVKNASGQIVAQQTLDPSIRNGAFTWDGTLANGNRAADGTYTLSISATDSAGGTVAPSIRSVGLVQNVNSANGSITLDVNGIQLPLAKVVKVSVAAEPA